MELEIRYQLLCERAWKNLDSRSTFETCLLFLVQARAEINLKFLLLLIFRFRLVRGAEENRGNYDFTSMSVVMNLREEIFLTVLEA